MENRSERKTQFRWLVPHSGYGFCPARLLLEAPFSARRLEFRQAVPGLVPVSWVALCQHTIQKGTGKGEMALVLTFQNLPLMELL